MVRFYGQNLVSTKLSKTGVFFLPNMPLEVTKDSDEVDLLSLDEI